MRKALEGICSEKRSGCEKEMGAENREREILEESARGIERRLKKLQTFTATPGRGVTRLPFSKEARRAADYLRLEMESAGLEAYVDVVGNVRGLLRADEPEAETIMMGSHYDTVKQGGAYDGAAGVVCALRVAELILRSGIRRKYNLEIIAFNDEEGMMFGSGCLGSKSLTGQVSREDIARLTDENGISIEEWMRRWGSEPEALDGNRIDLNKVRAFFEIHIEQGPVLDNAREEIGIVSCIVGLLRCVVTVEGRADHAGTTPMNMRQDAIGIAAKAISHLDEFADDAGDGAVATCGFIRAQPNAMNVVASQCEFTMDIRAKDAAVIDGITNRAVQILDEECRRCGAVYHVDIKLRQPPVSMAKPLMDRLAEKCEVHGYRYRQMLSGAAHDAMIFADKTDTAMVFVPSSEGRSHCPEEFSRCEDLDKAVQIVYETIADMMSGA